MTLLAAAFTASAAQAGWTTYHADPARSGVDQSSGASQPFASDWSTAGLGGDIWAQPLVYQGLVIVVNNRNDVIALNEATGQRAWLVHGGTPVPASALGCGDVLPTVGITSTPVIDPASGTLFAVADLWDGSSAHHELMALSAKTGAEIFRRNVDPTGSLPNDQLQRPGLGISGGRVLIGYGGNDGDCGNYRGYLVSAPEDNNGASQQWTSQTTKGDAIWSGGGAPAIDAAGDAYVSTGNGASISNSNFDHGNTLVKLTPLAGELDYFAPSSWAQDSASDADLGSAAPQLLPGGLAYQGGKNGNGYLVSTTSLGHIGGELFQAPECNSFGGDAYANGVIYVACADGIRALSLDTSARRFSLLWKGPGDANGPPIVAGGLVWVTAYGNAKLYGLDPQTGATRVTQATPSMVHFASPSASDGKLFLAAGQGVSAFTIAAAVALPQPPSAAPPPPASPPAPPRRRGACPHALAFGLVVGRGRRIVHVSVYRGRTRLLSRRGRRLTRASLVAPAASVTLRVVEIDQHGRRIRWTVGFRNCRRAALHHHRRRRTRH